MKCIDYVAGLLGIKQLGQFSQQQHRWDKFAKCARYIFDEKKFHDHYTIALYLLNITISDGLPLVFLSNNVTSSHMNLLIWVFVILLPIFPINLNCLSIWTSVFKRKLRQIKTQELSKHKQNLSRPWIEYFPLIRPLSSRPAIPIKNRDIDMKNKPLYFGNFIISSLHVYIILHNLTEEDTCTNKASYISEVNRISFVPKKK